MRGISSFFKVSKAKKQSICILLDNKFEDNLSTVYGVVEFVME